MLLLERFGILRAASIVKLSRPFVLLLCYYLLGMILFSLARLFFIVTLSDALDSVSIGEVVKAVLIGLRFDQVVVLYLLLIPVVLLPWLPLGSNWVRRLLVGWVTIAYVLSFLMLLVDVRFFTYFGSHLNFLALEYLDSKAIVWHLVVTEPMFVPYLATWVATSLVIAWIVHRLYVATAPITPRYDWTARVVVFVVVLALVFLGIRGRTDRAPIDWSIAYFSQNPTVNQLGLNGVFTLARAVLEEGGDLRLVYLPSERRFPFVDTQAALDTTRALLGTPNDIWLDPTRSMRRLTTFSGPALAYRPNIVLVIMESWSGRNTGALGATRGLTPRFDSLAAHGWLFTDFYASGTRTHYGLSAVLCSFPALPGRSILGRYHARHPFVTLPEVLGGIGYTNVFVYGGDLVFDNMEGFFRTQGFQQMLGQEYFGLDKRFSKWGVPDHIVFDGAVHLVDSLPRPFNLTLLTLSNHEPFALPDSSMRRYPGSKDSSKVFNAQIYADAALGRFMDSMMSRPVAESTLFVFVSDHARIEPRYEPTNQLNFHIPLLIYSPNILGNGGKRIGRVGAQVDILPTLLGLIGVREATHESWGRNLLDANWTDSGFATVSNFDRIGIFELDIEYRERLGYLSSLIALPETNAHPGDITILRFEDYLRLQRRLRAYMQAAEQATTPLPPDDSADSKK